MNTEITTQPLRANALHALAARISCDPDELIATLKQTVFKGASDAEFNALVIIANTYELNPILKELYAFPAKGGGIVPVVGIDGWLKIINRQSNYDGMTTTTSDDGQSSTTTIHVKGRAHPTVVTEYFAECSRGTEPWKIMPRRMLRHKSIIQAARVAFGISGVQDEDEASDTAMRNVTPEKKVTVRETAIDPFASIDTVASPDPEPTEERANGKTNPPEGKQTKPRIERIAKFKAISQKEGNGKTYYEVKTSIDGKLVNFVTFSRTMGEGLQGMEADTVIKITVVETSTPKQYAIESYELLTEEGIV